MKNNDIIVKKFGGSCIYKYDALKKIITPEDVIVVSAPGRRSCYDLKITDLLEEVYDMIRYGREYRPLWDIIKGRFRQLAKTLNADINLEREFAVIESNLKLNTYSKDYIMSRGEYLTALIIAKSFDMQFVDASMVIRFKDGELNEKRTNSLIRKAIAKNCVVPGYYGQDELGNIITFSRGGSDITGSLISASLGATEYQKWTDENGVKLASPEFVPMGRRINNISYDNMREMAIGGATILHPDSIPPVQKKKIPISINSINGDKYRTKVGLKDDNRYIKGMSTHPFTFRFEFDLKDIKPEKLKFIDSVLQNANITKTYEKISNGELQVFAYSNDFKNKNLIENLSYKISSIVSVKPTITAMAEITLVTGKIDNYDEMLAKASHLLEANNIVPIEILKSEKTIRIFVKDTAFETAHHILYHYLVDSSINDIKEV